MNPGFLAGRAAPWLFGLLSGLQFCWMWGSLEAVPTTHDEAAYVLQAEIFARGRWTAPAPLIPEFFEQIHVFVTPALASKYPPGHSFMLVPGVWLGAPALMPIVLSGLTGALVFALARRVGNPWIGILTWLLWTTAPIELKFRARYLSETTTTMLLLLAWWALLEWRRAERARWLVLVAACMGWSALTRPFSTLALLLPLGTIVLWTAARRKRWRDVAVAGLVGGALLLVIPLWSARTTGDPWTTPYALYSRIYFPYQRPGFGAPPAEPLRPLSNDMRAYADEFRSLHAEHTIANLPRIARRRLAALARGSWGGWRAPLLVFAIAGLFSLTRESGFAVVSALVFFLQYLFLAHSRGWTVYYLEIQPVLALVTALGIWRAASLAGARLRRSARAGLWPPGRFEAAAVLLVVFAAIGPAVFDAVWRREEQLLEAAPQERFRRVVRSIPGPAVIFVRYGPDHDSHRSLVVNAPDSSAAATWIVHDRGEDNARLMRAAPERIPSLYDETLGELRPLARPAPL